MRAFADTQEFVTALERAGELVRIRRLVSPYLEITEIADRVMKAGGPALLFENVDGSSFPVLINAYGSLRRMAMALGVEELDDLARRIEDMLDVDPPRRLMDKLKLLPKVAQLRKFPPKLVSHAPCQEVVLSGEDVDLARLPVLTCWPDDGGPIITIGQVFTQNPATGKTNVGMYRLQVMEKNVTGMHIHMHHDGARNVRESGVAPLACAVAFGGPSVMPYAATAPLPPEISELLLAGFIQGENVPVVKCKTVPLEVPATAEIVLEGFIRPDDVRREGPFGDHTGYYSLADDFPTFRVTAITHRRGAIYPTTIVGRPPMEDYWLGKATERIFLPLLKTQMPEVRDMNLPLFGVFHNFLFLSIKKQYPHHARKVMHAVWGTGQMMFSKFIVVVDDDVDVQDMNEVMFRLGANVDPKRDVVITEGPIDILDHASDRVGIGGKMGFDATRKWPGEGFPREWPEDLVMAPAVKEMVNGYWSELGPWFAALKANGVQS